MGRFGSAVTSAHSAVRVHHLHHNEANGLEMDDGCFVLSLRIGEGRRQSGRIKIRARFGRNQTGTDGTN